MPMQGLFELPEHDHAHDHSDIRAEVMSLGARLSVLEARQTVHETLDLAEHNQLETQLDEVEATAEDAAALATLAAIETIIEEEEPAREEEPPDATNLEPESTGDSEAGGESQGEATEEQPILIALEPESEPKQPERNTRFARGRR